MVRVVRSVLIPALTGFTHPTEEVYAMQHLSVGVLKYETLTNYHE